MEAMSDALGEAFRHCDLENPATGAAARMVSYVKHVVANGIPILIGSGYYRSAADR